MWQSLVTIGQATSERRLGGEKTKEDLNYSGKNNGRRPAIAGGRSLSASSGALLSMY